MGKAGEGPDASGSYRQTSGQRSARSHVLDHVPGRFDQEDAEPETIESPTRLRQECLVPGVVRQSDRQGEIGVLRAQTHEFEEGVREPMLRLKRRLCGFRLPHLGAPLVCSLRKALDLNGEAKSIALGKQVDPALLRGRVGLSQDAPTRRLEMTSDGPLHVPFPEPRFLGRRFASHWCRPSSDPD